MKYQPQSKSIKVCLWIQNSSVSILVVNSLKGERKLAGLSNELGFEPLVDINNGGELVGNVWGTIQPWSCRQKVET